MNKPAVSQARMRRAVTTLEALGKIVGGFRLHPDGTVDILTANGNAPLSSEPLDNELEAFKRSHGYD